MTRQSLRTANEDVALIATGGQSGVDQSAMAAALDLGLPIDGFIPSSRKCDLAPECPDGRTPKTYTMTVAKRGTYRDRTLWNVQDTDATLIVHDLASISPGTKLTIRYCEENDKPVLIYDLRASSGESGFLDARGFCEWLNEHNIQKLHVAGPRHCKSVGIFERAKPRLQELFTTAISQGVWTV